jgi:protein-S-isoprenylcysteine O-methyltransferase Ste14
MYLAWTLIYRGIAAVANTRWQLMLLPGVAAFTHYAVIQREERELAQKFGREYREYMQRVRRYL